MIPFGDEDRLLLVPGPTPVHRMILEALALPTISHTSVQLAEILKATLSRLSIIADNPHGKAFVFAGSGTLAQEAALVNFVSDDDRLLVVANGYFGKRMFEIATQHGLQATLIEAELGSCVSPEKLDQAISESGATVVAYTHVETATGVATTIARFQEVIRARSAFSIVDGVAAFGGIPEPMSEMGIDVLLTGAQKALGVPPGLAIICVGSTAWTKRETRSDPLPAYYIDLQRWAPVMEQPERYFSTHPVNLIRALACATSLILDEGLEARFDRHRRMAELFRSGLAGIGFEPLADGAHLASTLSALRTPATVTSSTFRERLYAKGVVAAGGIGDSDDRIVRFGHMGNTTEMEIAAAIDACRRVMESLI